LNIVKAETPHGQAMKVAHAVKPLLFGEGLFILNGAGSDY